MDKSNIQNDEATASTSEFASIGSASSEGKLTIGHYRLLECIGQGGMGTVYKALHTSLQKTVAFKVMTTNVIGGGSTDRFDREMLALGKLNHPNVVTAFDAGVEGGMQYIVTEFVEGLDVRELVRELGPLDPGHACRITSDAARGLAHIHSQDMVHRDVKPSNLMLTEDGQVKVLDLGLALLAADDGNQLTQSGQVMGTFDYMAPEQWGDTHAVDARADIYSLGCALFYMLTSHPPFGGRASTSAEKMKAHLLTPSPSVSKVRGDLPRELDRLIHSMLEKDPARRPQTMREVIARLESFGPASRLADMYHRAAVGEGHSTAVDDADMTRRHSRRLRIVSATTLALLGVAVAWFIAHRIEWNVSPAMNGAQDESPPAAVAVEAKAGAFGEHAARVNGVAISPDGRHIVSVDEDGRMCVTSARTHAVLANEVNHPQAISAVAFLDDGKLATACADGKWRTWALTPEGKLRAEETASESAGAGLNFIKGLGANKLVYGGWNNQVSICGFKKSSGPGIRFTSTDAVYDAAPSHDGTKLLWCGRAGVVRYENLQDQRLLHEWNVHAPHWVLSVDISADDRYAASCGWDETVRVFDLESGAEVASVPGVRPKVVRFLPQGRRLAFAGRTGEIVIWDIEKKQKIRVIQDHGPVDSLAVAGDGSYLVSGTDDPYTVSIWPLP